MASEIMLKNAIIINYSQNKRKSANNKFETRGLKGMVNNSEEGKRGRGKIYCQNSFHEIELIYNGKLNIESRVDNFPEF